MGSEKGLLKLRVCQNWDPTCSGVLADPGVGVAAGPVTEDLQMNCSSETLMSRDRMVTRVGGAVVQVSSDPNRGLCMTSQPELDLPPIAAAVLEEQGVDSLSYVLRLCHHGLALWHFRRWLHGPAMQCHAGDDLQDPAHSTRTTSHPYSPFDSRRHPKRNEA